MRIAVAYTETEPRDNSRWLADNLQLPLIALQKLMSEESLERYDFFFSYHQAGLCLHGVGVKNNGGLSVNFSDPKLKFRANSSIRNQNIIKAIGIKSGARPKVLDGTAGLGKDAFLLANIGCEVLLLERSEIVHALLRDGLMRAAQEEGELASAVARMELQRGDFLDFDKPTALFDVVYLDPMFPVRRKTAKVKKDMALLQQLLGHQADNGVLLEHAKKIARKRVVVKRAKLSPYMADLKPDIEFKGSSSRYDVYLTG